jgi:hypothetical protein
MPVIEYPRPIDSSGHKHFGKVSEKPEQSELSALCAFREICPSRLCQFTDNDCPGSQKGN